MKRIQTNRKHRLSGFTLMELIVVIAIIAILTTILVPTMRGYITKSRLSTANSEAKVLYNSIQTIMQEFEFRERQMETSAFYGPSKKEGDFFLKGIDGEITQAYSTVRGGTKVTGSTIFDLDNLKSSPNPLNAMIFKYNAGENDIIGANLASADAATIGARLSRLYSDYTTVSWAAYIEDYSVRGVFCATNATTDYVGAYPLRAAEKGDNFGTGVALDTTINSCNISSMRTYSAVAWTVAPAGSGSEESS